jgi:flagellar motor switch protein FliN/FliY
MAGGPDFKTTEQWLSKEWALRLKQSVEAMTGEPSQVHAADGGEPPGPGTCWWRQPFELGAGAAVWVGAPEATWSAIGARVLAGAGIDDSTEEDRRSTYQEILQQALAGLAHGFTGLVGREVVAGRGGEGPAPEAVASEFQVSLGGGPPLALYAAWSAELVGGLSQPGGASQKSKTAEAAKPRAAAAAAANAADSPHTSAPPPGPEAPTRTLDLLYDVELPVSVSFGRALMPLKEVLKLTSGSIVELNRTVMEPVEVIVNNCVIARGEVVVVEGNYGVRIQQIVSRSERLRTLH